ncbi:MAG: DHH family phosphoesterase, partial [bacterium]|nr:DHH family phosphoesterase [bacterium]
MKCFHHNDLDGWCAGAIVFHASDKKCEMIEIDYKDRFPLEVVALGEKVVIVDFSIKPPVMKELLKRTRDILWLDHHKTAMEYEKKYGVVIPGIRSNDYSGCELAWMVLCEGKPMPRAVELIGDMDKWAWKFDKETS